MPIRRQLRPNAGNVLTPEAVQAILAKEALLRAGVTASASGNITSDAPQCYVFIGHGWSDSAATVPNREADDDHSRLTMLASESVLRQDWDSPEEDEAWAHL